METWYFPASRDSDAVAAINHPGGPSSEVARDLVLAAPVRGPEFTYELAVLARPVAGRGVDLEDAAGGLLRREAGQTVVLSRTPTELISALADLPETKIADMAEQWGESVRLADPAAAPQHVADLRRLAALATNSRSGFLRRPAALYCLAYS
ncbi:hypothetical protein RDV89_08585 [Nocardioides zeae]|uniref:Uncharacterized protein n=1 Tax=Nocardioides imazamoxiresistens TaxID=3231893 RepID=A0ABU3PV61_9ACTN|nr:hypothetical protein [Nocardioides zeae]MDT9593122.1 hypothetical protein [Nocardioides zeae]